MKNVLALLCILFFSLSCATKKTAQVSDDDLLKSPSGYILEVNGDSDSGRAGSLQSIHFAFKSAEIEGDIKRVMDENAAFLTANQKVEVQIEGHTDERGSAQFNLTLGEKRAKSVLNYLISRSVSASRIHIVSYGKEKPLGFLHEEESWAKNRRANFVILQK